MVVVDLLQWLQYRSGFAQLLIIFILYIHEPHKYLPIVKTLIVEQVSTMNTL